MSDDYNVLSIDIDWCQSHFHLDKLNKLFYDKIGKAKKIVFAKHHHQIVPEIVNQNNIVLHNIDHHHDIQYEDWQIPDIESGKSTHGCWVGNMMAFKKIKEYYWYNNLDSDLNFTNFVSLFLVNENLPFSIEDDLNKAKEVEVYDLIFVCHSPDYVTSVWGVLYQSYFDCCKTLYNSKTTTNKLATDMRNSPIFLKMEKHDERSFKRFDET